MQMDFDIPSISAIVAAVGVLVGVVIALIELRNLVKQRQTDLVTRLSRDIAADERALDAFVDIMESEFDDYDDFVKRYGKFISKNQVPMSFMIIGNSFEQIGVLLRNKLIDASLVDQLFPISIMWEKMKPLVEGMRKEYHDPTFFEWFEYLYNEMKKRKREKFRQPGVMNGSNRLHLWRHVT
jgi:hypothetical protein